MATSAPPASLSDIMRVRSTHYRARSLSIATLLVLLTGTLAGQTANPPSPAPEQTTVPPLTAPGAMQATPPEATPAPAAPEAHSMYPHRQAQVPSTAAAPTPPASNASVRADGNQTLHVIVGRSVFINTPDRLRRIYVSNPTVIDSMTPSPRDLVITGKTAGTSSVVLWDETGQFNRDHGPGGCRRGRSA